MYSQKSQVKVLFFSPLHIITLYKIPYVYMLQMQVTFLELKIFFVCLVVFFLISHLPKEDF